MRSDCNCHDCRSRGRSAFDEISVQTKSTLRQILSTVVFVIGIMMFPILLICIWSVAHNGSADPRCALHWHDYYTAYDVDSQRPRCVYLGDIKWNKNDD